MPTFEYQAKREDGSTETGVVVGSSLDGAAASLQAKGVRVTRIRPAQATGDPLASRHAPMPDIIRAPAPGANPHADTSAAVPAGPPTGPRSYVETSVLGPLVGKVPLTRLAFFFRQAATMLHAGVPTVQAFHTLAGQARHGKLSSVIEEIAGHVEVGNPISAGMQRYPEVFSPVMVSLVRAGEQGGFLDTAFGTVADYLDQEIELRNLYRRLTFYPKLQIAASVLIVTGANLIISVVRPGAPGLSSPLSTPSTWLWLGPLLIALFLFFRVGLANQGIKQVWDFLGSNIPYLGTTSRQVAMARFGRAFGALYRGGVPISQAVALSADACGNEYLRARMYPAAKRLEEGRPVSEVLAETGAFSPIVLDMVRTGERTGNLDGMLNKMAEYYAGESKVRATQSAYVVGVLVFLFVAAYIGYIVVSFYTGYFGNIMQAAEG